MSVGQELSGSYFTAMRHSTAYDYISPLKLDLAGKHVLIAGAAWKNRAGYATARAFARAGASAIAITDIHGILDNLAAKLRFTAVEAGCTEPVVLGCMVDITV
ncbi:hypothetical protein BDW71DRAFT_207437 [Aspergillus fruticulosus]